MNERKWSRRVRPDAPRLGRVLVVDGNNSTVAVVEHMRADADANGAIIEAAPALADLLRRLVDDLEAVCTCNASLAEEVLEGTTIHPWECECPEPWAQKHISEARALLATIEGGATVNNLIEDAADALLEAGYQAEVHLQPIRLIEVGTETPVPDAGREGRGEVLTQRESEAMTRTLRWYGSLPGGHAEFYQDVDNLRLAGRAALQERLEASEGRLTRIASAAVIRGRCVFCAHPDDPADGSHTSTCPVIDPDSDPCPYVHDSGDRCGLQFEHGGSHDFDY